MENAQTAKTIIAEDVEITGTIKCASNIQIDGKLNGDLNCAGNAVIGGTAAVKGNMSVNSVTVQGHINGNITAKDRIELKSTANITGDIRGKRLSVEDGVTFVGKSEVNPSGAASTRANPQSETKPATPESASENDDTARSPDGKDDGRAKAGSLFGRR